MERSFNAGRSIFAVSLAAMGALVPAWIPAHLVWTYGIGCALMAAGLAMMSGITAQLAATMLAIMFGETPA